MSTLVQVGAGCESGVSGRYMRAVHIYKLDINWEKSRPKCKYEPGFLPNEKPKHLIDLLWAEHKLCEWVCGCGERSICILRRAKVINCTVSRSLTFSLCWLQHPLHCFSNLSHPMFTNFRIVGWQTIQDACFFSTLWTGKVFVAIGRVPLHTSLSR